MWRPPINFITLHYAWILFMGLLSIPVLLPEGNLKAVDAYFFGASASTESGLNTVDVKELRTYQQLYIYFIPMFTNLGFINAFVVLVRLIWFRKHLQKNGPALINHRQPQVVDLDTGDVEALRPNPALNDESTTVEAPAKGHDAAQIIDDEKKPKESGHRVAFDPSTEYHPRKDATLYIPGPRDRDRGAPLYEIGMDDKGMEKKRDDTTTEDPDGPSSSTRHAAPRRRLDGLRGQSTSVSMDRIATVASSVFVLGSPAERRHSVSVKSHQTQMRIAKDDLLSLSLSRQATIGRNSQFHRLTELDRERLGGIEYRSLKLLLKIVLGYFFGLQLFGAIGLVGWIQYANPKYRDYLEEMGQDMNWWAFYSAQTMVDNLGFTLTPDSMIYFRDAAWPMILLSFLAFAGNTLYPVFLRLVIWTMSKLLPQKAAIQEPLSFLLNHPRRCYTLLFPSGPTWILFGIIFALNFIDVVLILVLDLHHPEVSSLPAGKRILASIFQAASARHTGTASFNLANVNPAVQFSLLVMMYIAIFPIAISIRASNTYEERSLGIYENEGSLDEERGSSYLLTHMRNQLSFDLWYIFLGTFLICIAEADRIQDVSDPAIAVFPILFEVTSAYGNVGLSLGYPTVMTSLAGELTTFSKLILCAVMIRGRHRGLPYALDRAIMLPEEHPIEDHESHRG